MKAGIPVAQDDYIKMDVEGIPFFVRKDLAGKEYRIDWKGVWILGQFSVREI